MKKIQIVAFSLLLAANITTLGMFPRSAKVATTLTATAIAAGTLLNNAADTTGDLTTAPMPRCPFGPMLKWPQIMRTSYESFKGITSIRQQALAQDSKKTDTPRIVTPFDQDHEEGPKALEQETKVETVADLSDLQKDAQTPEAETDKASKPNPTPDMTA